MISAEYVDLAQIVGIVLGPAGAAWVGIRVGLNGTRQRVERIENKVDHITDQVGDVRERVAALEAK